MNKPIIILSFVCVALFSATTHAQTIKIKNSDVTNDKYSFVMGFSDMAYHVAEQEFVSRSTSVSIRHENAGPIYVTPDASANHAEIRLKFDFSASNYVVESVYVRDAFNFFANPNEPSDALVKATISSDKGEPHDLWSLLCRKHSRHEAPFESTVTLDGPQEVTYSVSMDIPENSSPGQFGDAAFQWNRLSSSEDDSTRAYMVVFKLNKVR